MNAQAGVALLRLAAFLVAAVLVGLVLAVFARGASTSDETTGIATVQTAVFFFGPLAAIATLAFIVVLALTRPVSLALRRRAARLVAVAYALIGAALAITLSGTWWGLLGGTAAAVAAGLSWWFLGRDNIASTGD
ncbi:MAG: hypothetical protein ACO21P_00935 [Candidatus Nanopelagicales bacterium]